MAEMLYQRDVYGQALAELGRANKNIVVLDADLSSSTRTCLFSKEFPERFFNFGVAEQDMVATAAGLASCGKTVFISSFAMFATGRTWDQIRNSVAYNNFNVKIVATHAGVTVGPDGASHQALEDIALMGCFPLCASSALRRPPDQGSGRNRGKYPRPVLYPPGKGEGPHNRK
jgi:transketolase